MIVVLLLALATRDVVVRGGVVDPHQRPLASAAVEIACAEAVYSGRANDGGRFEIEIGAAQSCEIRVSYPGFKTLIRTIAVPSTTPLTFELAPADWEERVEVRPARQAPPTQAATTTLDGAALAADAMRVAGPDSARWLTLAERAAGMPLGGRVLTVNGMPASRLPPAESIVSIAAAMDPFSAETAGADRVTIDMVSEPPPRWQFDVSPGLLTSRQHDPLLDEAVHSDRRASFGAGGPLTASGRLRALVSISAARSQGRPVYVERTDNGDRLASSIESSMNDHGWNGEVYGARGAWVIDAAASRVRSSIGNGGVGGRSGPPARLDSSSTADREQLTWRRAGRRVIFRGGVAFDRERRGVSSPSSGAGFVFADRLVAGAPDVVAVTGQTRTTTIRATATSTSAPVSGWLVGMEAGNSALDEHRQFNPSGVVFMTAPTEFTGARVIRTGEATVRVRTRHLAGFAQRVVAATSRIWVRAGARTEWQREFGVTVSPRGSIGLRAGHFLLAGNIGTFSDLWDASDQLERGMRLAAPAVIEYGDERPALLFTGHGARRTDIVSRSAIARPFLGGSIGIEQLVRMGRRLSGLTRRLDTGRAIDAMDDERSLRRRQTRVRIDLGHAGWTASGFYEYANAVDDTAGPFSLPASGGERGPSSGIPSHALTGTLSGRLRGVRLLVSGRMSSGTRYSLLTGADPQGLFTFNERVGGVRNRERTPASSDLSSYLARQFQLPVGKLSLDCGVRVENILAALTPLDVERSAASALAGQPVSAARGRSISLWTTVGRR